MYSSIEMHVCVDVLCSVALLQHSTLPLFSAQLRNAQEEQHCSVKVGLLHSVLLPADACTTCSILLCCSLILYVLTYVCTCIQVRTCNAKKPL